MHSAGDSVKETTIFAYSYDTPPKDEYTMQNWELFIHLLFIG